jgi:hypothetical protein
MTTPHASTAIFTAASPVLAGLVVVGFRLLTKRTAANLWLAGFVACAVASPLMFVAHVDVAIAMAAIGLVCAVPACILADYDDDGRGGGGGEAPSDTDPDPGPDVDHWEDFEREFWSHVERARELVQV